MAHFFEHMAFKGTRNRTQAHLAVEVENMGAQLNAYTSREQTVFYCSALRERMPEVVNMLSDIIQHPLVTKKDVDSERDVILRESQEIDNMMDEVTFDYLHAVSYEGTPLEQTILGSIHNIKTLRREQLIEFVESHYRARHMILAAAGGVDHDALVNAAETYWHAGAKLAGARTMPDPPRGKFVGNEKRLSNMDMQLAHIALAVEGCSWTDPDFFALKVANVLMGDWNRMEVSPKAPLAQVLSRREGCHTYTSPLTCYADTGLWGTYYTADPTGVEHTALAVLDEWKRLCQHVTEEEVRKAVQTVKTQFFSNLDTSASICEEIGRQLLVFGRRMPLAEVDARLEAVTAEWVMDACSRRILNKRPALVAIGPVDSLPSLDTLSAKLKV
ncbi:mitochondrial-processing peptidase subunit beta-like isoform X2 [Sycon ciliatum]